jgi:hypothetical protein
VVIGGSLVGGGSEGKGDGCPAREDFMVGGGLLPEGGKGTDLLFMYWKRSEGLSVRWGKGKEGGAQKQKKDFLSQYFV